MDKKFDLEDRTLIFSKNIITFCRSLPKETVNFTLIDQLVRSATSIGANYREANDALGKKDFGHRVRIARKEAKETSYWLELVKDANPNFSNKTDSLLKECCELRNILSAILKKFEN